MSKKVTNILTGLGLGFFSISSAAAANKLNFDVYNPGSASVFAVTSTIIEGAEEIALIDAQFQMNDAKKLVEKIKAKNKKLAFVFISHSDPDYYFGLEAIREAFPDVKIITTQKTHDDISKSMDDKLAYWGTILKDNAPRKLILPEVIDKTTLELNGEKIEIKEAQETNSYLWIPSEKTILGGGIINENMHIWIADAPTKEQRQEWISVLDGIIALNPDNVIAGHFLGDYKKGTDSLFFTKNYIENFNEAEKNSKDSSELINLMKEKYKNLNSEDSLIFSAKVVKSEEKWPAVPAFPGLGKIVEVNFGETVFQLKFHDDKNVSFVGTEGTYKGVKDTAVYNAVEIRSGLYMVYWNEKNSKANVVHIEDYDRGLVYTNIANEDGSFHHMSGTLKIIGDIE